ncbi:MAG TPA: hypothetical protein VG323_16860 [Thermoanaerobaculia bacterium]|nr:hypothetical protein [Thermoanaerobaculia bacterium]
MKSVLFCLLVAGVAVAAFGSVTAAPGAVSAFPTQTTPSIHLSLTFAPSAGAPGVVSASGMPAGVTTVPALITYSAPAGSTSASTNFSFSVGAATVPGVYPITLTDNSHAAGATIVTLTVNTPSYMATPSPNPLTLVIGGGTRQVSVNTTPDPGFNSPEISYSFSGFPAFITNDGPKITTVATSYAPVTFNFSLGPSPIPGTYTGTLTGTLVTLATKSFPFTVTIPQPDIAATFTQPVLQVCPGQTVNDSVHLTPVNGYSGTPSLTFTSAPPGITINPVSPPAAPMPPAETVAFTVSAASGASSGIAVLHISDPASAINKNVQLQINVVGATFTPGIWPSALALSAGGAAQNVQLFFTPTPCFSGTVTVTPSGMPPGMTMTPNPATITGTETIVAMQAAASTPAGTYSVTFAYTSGSITKTLTIPVTVSAAPDFVLNLNPPSLTIAAGASGTTTATITPVNGFSGSVTVTAPASANVTFSPSTFTLTPGASQPVTVSVAAGTPPGTQTFLFSASSPSVSGTHTAMLTVTTPATGDFALQVSPPGVSAIPGTTFLASIAATSIGGFTGPVSVTAPNIPGITITPAAFTVVPGGAFQQVSITIAAGTPAQQIPLTFTGTASVGTHTTTMTLTVVVPHFTLTLTPSALTIPAGGTATVDALLLGNNAPFVGTVNVTAPVTPGVTFSPATFTLAVGQQQRITISIDSSAAPGFRGDLLFKAVSLAGVSGEGATLSLTISGAPDFTVSASPPALTIPAGGSGNVTITTAAVNGFTGSISVAAQPVAGLTFSPQSFILAPGASQAVAIVVGPAVPQGPLRVVFAATAAGVAHTATVLVTVGPPAPILTSAGPTSLVAGTQSTIVRVVGDFFQPGAQFRSSDPSLVIESAQVLTAQLADLRISVRPDAAPGPRTLSVTNPDGATSATPLVLFVYPTTSIAAPLDVLAAAIVYPARGTLIAHGEAVYPRALLATAGTGTIIGSWQLDGATFDRFVVNAAGGMPVEVRANVQIPSSFDGTHALGIVLESPRKFVSPLVEIIDSADRVSRLTLLAPRDGGIVRAPRPLFRWSLVPNCSGYDVEVAPLQTELALRFHVADAEWRPSTDDLRAIGPGVHRWRVRARCAGGVETEPTAWQRFAVTPERVAITILPMRGRTVRWDSGGAAGVVYRVDFDGLSALTARTEYALPKTIASGTSVRISAIAPDGVVVGAASAPIRQAVQAIHLAQQTLIELGDVEPADGAAVGTAQPHIAAQWKGAAKPEEITLLLDNTDVTQVAKVMPTSIAYDALTPLAPGPHSVAVSVAGNIKRWTFTVEGAAAAPEKQPRGDWVLAPIGNITIIRGANNEAHTQISALTDLNSGAVTNKLTGDVGVKHDFANDRTVQESRNWVGDVGAQQSDVRKETLRFGFAQPDFFDQAQFLNAGLARGGFQAKVAVPGGTVSYYETFTSHLSGLATGLFGLDQKLRAGAWQIPVSEKWDFRILGLRVEDDPGVNSAGGRGRAFGLFTRFAPSPMFSAFFEGAHGNFTPGPGSQDVSHSGDAWRIGLLGVRGTANYAFNVRKTDGGFINPANRGFTAGGVPDRTAADLTVGKIFGTTSVNVQLRHMQDGAAEGLAVPRTRQSGGVVSLNKVVNEHVNVAVSGNATKDKSEENAQALLPGADRVQRGATGTVTEVFGRFNFSETLSQQALHDHVSALNDQTITAATLASGGQFTDKFNLSSCLTHTRTAGSAIAGTTSQDLASLQPTLLIPRFFLTLQPRMSYGTSKNDLISSKTTTEQYAGLLNFAPQWFNSIVALQLSADWTRNKTEGQPAPLVHRYVAAVNLHWRLGAGPAYTAGAPAAQPVAAPNPSASAPPK